MNRQYSSTFFFIFLLILPFKCLIAQTSVSSDSLSSDKRVYAPLRYDEDWSFLRDPALRTEWFDRLKFVRVGNDKSNYVTVGGESRLRFEYYHNENLGASPYTDNAYLQQRSFLHADVHFFKHFRLFTQLNSSTTHFRNGGPRPIFDKDVVDLNQAFIDISIGRERRFTLRTGRQELQYGNGKLVEPREGPNQRLAFNAVRMILRSTAVNIESFIGRPVTNKQESFDNIVDSDIVFWGIYASRIKVKSIGFDIYYFGINNNVATFEKGTGKELRHTLGFKLNAGHGNFEYETENFFQIGSFSGSEIFSWGSTLTLNYTLPAYLLNSRIGLGASITSGDQGITDDKFRTFNGLFPTGFYFGPPALPVGPSNLKSFRISLSSAILKNLMFMPSWNMLWRQSDNDGIYTPASTLLRPSGNSEKGYVGRQLNLVVLYRLSQHLTIATSYANFKGGSFLEETGPNKAVSYVNTDLTYKF